MKRLFISCPMRGRTDEAISESIKKMHKIAEAIFGEELEIVQRHILVNEPPQSANERLWCLGKAIQMMAESDYFIGIFDEERDYDGCIIENHVAKLYGIPHYLINIAHVAPDVMAQRKAG